MGLRRGGGEVSGRKRGGWDLGRGEYIELVVVVYIYAYERVVESSHGAYIHAALTYRIYIHKYILIVNS